MILTPIVYGLTQLSNAPSPDEAQDFLEMFCALTRDEDPLNPDSILRYMDKIVPLVPSKMTNWRDVPDWMQRFMEQPNYLNYMSNFQDGVNLVDSSVSKVS
jgi:hypothetical protein